MRWFLASIFVCLLVLSGCNQPGSEVDSPIYTDVRVSAFDVENVRLLDSPFEHARQKDAEYLLALDPDRLLHRFRLYAGLEPKGELYGGWEAMSISGHSLGHYQSALAMMYAGTGDEVFKERSRYITSELAACQEAMGTGYFGAIPGQDKMWEEVIAGDIRSQGFDLNGAWVPWYNLHKVFAGLIDSYTYTGDEKALEVAKGLADWAYTNFIDMPEDQFQEMLACEHGGINESLAELHALTGNKNYLDLAKRFHHDAILDPLAAGKDHLAGKHANTQIPKLIGTARIFELTGSKPDSSASAFFWDTMVNNHTYANGGNSDHEHLGEPGQLAGRISENSSETCNTYNMLKLSRHLQQWQLDGKKGDYIERALLNHILPSLNPETGMVTYYVPLNAGGQRTYGTMFDSFWCCTGSGMENHIRYGQYIYYQSDEAGDLIIDQYIPSQLSSEDWNLEMTAGFPEADMAVIHLDKIPAGKRLVFRKPSWSEDFKILVNDQEVDLIPYSSGYVTPAEELSGNVNIEVHFGMKVRTESMPDNQDMQAVFYGPVMLAGVLDTTTFTTSLDFPVFISGDLTSGIQQESDDVFRTVSIGKPADVKLKPFYELVHSPYLIYFNLYNESEWEEHRQGIIDEKERLAELERNSVDILRVGEMQPERDHNLVSENSSTGTAFGRKWRHAISGWFEFTMDVLPDEPNILSVTYWGSDSGDRKFDILVNGEVIATESLEANHPNEFYDEQYTIPLKFTSGKESITIRFQSKRGNTAGGIFGCRILRSTAETNE